MGKTSALLAAIAALGPIPPAPRIIVGFPEVGANECLDCPERGLLLMGETAWAKLKMAAHAPAPATPADVHHEAVAMLSGVRVEHYHETHHGALAVDLVPVILAHRLSSEAKRHAR